MGFFKEVKKAVKKVAPLLAAAATLPMGGPTTAIAAASAVGASQHGKGNKLKGALGGGLQGLAYAAMAPTMASHFGATAGTTMGRFAGLQHPSLLSQLGMASAPTIGGGLGLFANAAYPAGSLAANLGHTLPGFGMQTGLLGGQAGIAGASPSIFSKLGGLGAMASKLGPLLQIGANVSKNAMDKRAAAKGEGYDSGTPGGSSSGVSHGEYNPYEIARSAHPYAAIPQTPIGDIAFPALEAPQHTRYRARKGNDYAAGGHVKHSDSDGQADDYDTHIPQHSYVMNATDVSLFGNGSSDNGVKKLNHFVNTFEKKGIVKPGYDASLPHMKVKLSNDEYVIKPSVVAALGKGNPDKGAKVLDKSRERLRKQKGVREILPPKAKDVMHYVRGGRG